MPEVVAYSAMVGRRCPQFSFFIVLSYTGSVEDLVLVERDKAVGEAKKAGSVVSHKMPGWMETGIGQACRQALEAQMSCLSWCNVRAGMQVLTGRTHTNGCHGRAAVLEGVRSAHFLPLQGQAGMW